ncbi:MAG: SelT/SelW/SelH family protein [Halobacteriaceae archaeon]
MTDVEIQYCVPCGHLDNAIDTQRELLEEFGQRLDGVRLKTGDSGIFVVTVDDETVYDNRETDDGFDIDEVKDAIQSKVSA